MVGIYQIVNKVNGNKYVGQSINIASRKSSHFYALRKNTHRNLHLQRAVNTYGIENFEFTVLLCCDAENLVYYEQVCVDKLQPEYNIRRECVMSSLGVRQSEETILKRIAHIRGVPLTDEHKQKLSQAHLGYKHNEESKRKMREAKGNFSGESTKRCVKNPRGKYQKHTPEYKQKLLEEKKNKLPYRMTDETKRKISEMHTGMTHTEETKKKMSAAKKKVWENEPKKDKVQPKNHISDETRRKMSEARIGTVLSEETKRKMSESAKKRWQRLKNKATFA